MARQVLPIAGAIIGGAFGAPQLGFAIGSLIGNAVDPMQIQGPKIGDMAVQTSRDGVPRPIVFGTAAVFGNIIDRSEPRIVKKKERQGKGGPETVTEHVYMSFAIRICEGPITSISRIWENEKLVYDVTAGSAIVPDSARFIEKVTFYLGGETQLPDPTLEALHGVGNTPAHRGTAYAVWNSKDLTEFGGAIPQYRFEVSGVAASDPFWADVYSLLDCAGTVGTETYQDAKGLTWTNDADPADPIISTGGGFAGGANSLRFDPTAMVNASHISHQPTFFSSPEVTIDGYVTFNTIAGTQIVASAPNNSGVFSWEIVLSAGNLELWTVAGGAVIISGSAVSANTPIHYEVSTNSSGEYYFFINGALQGTYAAAAAPMEISTIRYGNRSNYYPYPLDGWMTHMRITLAQRHTASFTAPSLPFPQS